jgi:hypothetical protein
LLPAACQLIRAVAAEEASPKAVRLAPGLYIDSRCLGLDLCTPARFPNLLLGLPSSVIAPLAHLACLFLGAPTGFVRFFPSALTGFVRFFPSALTGFVRFFPGTRSGFVAALTSISSLVLSALASFLAATTRIVAPLARLGFDLVALSLALLVGLVLLPLPLPLPLALDFGGPLLAALSILLPLGVGAIPGLLAPLLRRLLALRHLILMLVGAGRRCDENKRRSDY